MAGNAPSAYDLRADGALNPYAFGAPPRRLHWRVRGEREPRTVSIAVASSLERLRSESADLWRLDDVTWTHPWVDWPESVSLESRARVAWRVKLSTPVDPGEWSAPAFFEVGLLEPVDWSAAWITHPAHEKSTAAALPRLVRDFMLDSPPVQARLYVTGLGVQETFVNGVRVGDAYLAPGYADYRRRIPVTAWDVTSLLREGPNRMAAALGTGVASVRREAHRYTKLERHQSPPRYLAQLEVHGTGGRTVVSTDESWVAELGPSTEAHWYGGQDQVRERAHDWRTFGSALRDAVPAVAVGAATSLAPLWWTTTAPVRVVDELPARSVRRTANGTRVFDFGTNVAGQLRGEFRALDPGAPVEFWPAELLSPDGTVDQATTGTPIFDRLVSDRPAARFEPSLVYHGFRYAEVTGLPDAEPDTSLRAAVLRADLPRVGVTATSDPFIDRLHGLIDRAVQSNMFSVFTDCPHREKLGWNEQLYLCFDTISRSFDAEAHLRAQLAHIRDSQQASGMVPSISPELIDFSGDQWRGDPHAFRDDPNWGSAIVFVPWALHRHYADTAALVENWEAMVRYAEYLRSREIDGILDHGLGDWIALDTTTPRALVATFGYQRMLATLSRIASVLGRRLDAAAYAERAAQVLTAFRSRFGDATGTHWGSGSQGSSAIALDLGAVPPDAAPAVLKRLIEALEQADGQFTVGENTLPSLLRVLASAGRHDLIDRAVRSADGPGYGHQIASGATALTESWQGPGGPSAQRSQNHFMLGMIDDWITGDLAGLRQHPDSIGWQRVTIAPVPLDRLDWATTRFSAPSGEMTVSWSRNGTGIELEVALPPGVTGELVYDGAVGELTGTSRHRLPAPRTTLTVR